LTSLIINIGCKCFLEGLTLTHLRSSVALLLISVFLIGIIGPAQVSAVSANQTKANPEDVSEDAAEKTPCIQFESAQKLIKIRCKSTHLTDVYKELNDPSILGIENPREGTISGVNHRNIWILDAGIVVEREGSLIIDPFDTSWLKITATPTLQIKGQSQANEDTENDTASGKVIIEDTNNTKGKEVIAVSKHNGDNPNGIHVHGSLKIDSVKITSWDPEKKDVVKLAFGKRPGEEHTKSDYDTAEPRAFIRISKLATGTTNITNSELAYLGYSCSRCAGLSYYGGEGSVIKNSNIHHLLKGFYSKNMGQMHIEGNKFHDNYLYGIDPHTGSHDMVIRNNKVYGNNASGIICSKDCYNLLIEGNKVYENGGAGRGIAFSINTTNSIARNNDVHNNENCISFNRESNNNQVYKNTISNCDIGIYLSNTSKNSINDNSITQSESGIVIKGTSNNITNNMIDKTKTGITYINKIANTTNPDTNPYNETKIEHYLDGLESTNKLSDVSNPSLVKTGQSKGLKELID
jgi:mannuronan 5-epimerase